MNNIAHWLYNILVNWGFSQEFSKVANFVILLILILVVIFVIDYGLRKFLVHFFTKLAERSKTHFDDYLVKNKVPRNLAHVIPLLLAFKVTPLLFADFKPYIKYTDKGLKVFVVVLTLVLVRGLLNTLEDYFKTRPRLKDKPIDSYIQVFMIFAWIIGLLSMFAIITETPFFKFVTALGAASAVILLIFKDTILGFVASIQVSINDMVRIGDWITFEKFGADGDVIEINLATVKVQNFDKTITTIPTYALISDSFRNWRGMMESDGRRIKRALYIKQDSVRFLTNEDIERLMKIEIIRPYLETRSKEINAYNESHSIDKSIPANGRNLTNIGVFRKYMDMYLNKHSGVNKNMTLMVRQLAPGSQGVALEVYAFTVDKRWENYEYIMADLFDHFIAAIPSFDLALFEFPSNVFLPEQHKA